MRRLVLVLLVTLAPATCTLAVVVEPPLHSADANQWQFIEGDWHFGNATLAQTETTRRSAAVLREPAFGDLRLSVDFHIAPEGTGVRAAAIIFRATGTQTYYWLHMDSKHRQFILVRSEPGNGWIEIARTRCPELTDGTWHTAQVSATGAQIVCSLNGQEVLRATDANLPGGRVGLGTSQGHVIFRNLSIEGEVDPMAAPLKPEQPPFRVISRGAASGPYQAFPDACRLQNGDIAVVFYAGYGHVSLPNDAWPKGGRICMVRSSDEGRTWSEPVVIFDNERDNRDPHIAQLRDGTLVCTYFDYWREGGATRYYCALTRSVDGGKTWEQQGQQVTPAGWACSAPVREMPDGTLILGVYREGAQGSYGGVVRSTDHGRTWSAPIPIGQEANLPLDAETDVILLRDGTLFAALRSSSINMHYATSGDLGLTWTPVRDIGFKGHAPHLTRLRTGEILLTHRVPATSLHVSRDECRTWQGPFVLDTVGGAYPATVELKNGSVLVVYYEEGEGSAIRALRFRLKPAGIEFLQW